jgi:hypothetical protein
VNSDVLTLLVFVAFIALSLLGRRKKKPSQAQRSRPAPRPQLRETAPRRASPPRPPQRRPGDALRDLLAEIERAGEPRPEPRSAAAPEPDEAVSLEVIEEPAETARWMAGIERTATSLETAEPAGEASHKRFRDRYKTTAAARDPPAAAASVSELATLRRAIIWSEILAPPVALRE